MTSKKVYLGSLAHRILTGLAMLTALGGCTGPTPSQVPSTTAPATTQPSPATSTNPERADSREDLDALWRRWQVLNDDCRGGQPSAATEKACADRDTVMREQAFASSAAFLAAWRAHDASKMRSLTHPSNLNDARRIPEDLLQFSPTEAKFSDCTYDMRNSGVFACYMTVAGGGPSLYFTWENTYDKGWLVRSFAPDV